MGAFRERTVSTDAGDSAVGLASSPKGGRWHLLLGTAAVGLLALVPLTSGPYFVGLIGRFLVFGLLAMSLDLLWGYTGQLSFGHAAFFGLGAYATGLILAKADVPALGVVAIVAGIGLPALLGLVMGAALFYGKVSGVYFAIITLLVSLLLEQLAITWIGFTGGINGLFGMAPLTVGPLVIDSLTQSYYAILVVCAIAYLAASWLVSTSFGRAMQAVRINESRAASLGYSTAAVKTLVFTIACGLAGVAGVLYVPLEGFVYPTQLGLISSTGVIVWLAIGGRGTLAGGFVGAFVVNYLESLLSDKLVSYWLLATGVFLVIVVLVSPGGILGLVQSGVRRLESSLRRRRSDA